MTQVVELKVEISRLRSKWHGIKYAWNDAKCKKNAEILRLSSNYEKHFNFVQIAQYQNKNLDKKYV